MEQKEIKFKICENCGKIIKSLYQNQLEYNFDAHKLSCDRKQKED